MVICQDYFIEFERQIRKHFLSKEILKDIQLIANHNYNESYKLFFKEKVFQLSFSQGKFRYYLEMFVLFKDNYKTAFDMLDYLTYTHSSFDKRLMFGFDTRLQPGIDPNMVYVFKGMTMQEIFEYYFEQVNNLLSTEEMQRILNTDYCPIVPIDWSRVGY